MAQGKLAASPIRDHVAAVSVGIVEGTPLLDLEYVEDSACDTDMNVVMTGARRLRRGAGHGRRRSRSRARRWTRCWRWPTRAFASWSRRRRRRWTWLRCAGPGVEQREEARPSCATLFAPLPIELVPQGALGIAEADEPHAHLRRERAGQGAACGAAQRTARRSPTTRACASMRWAARRACVSAHFAPSTERPDDATARRGARAGRCQQRAAARAPARPDRPPCALRQHAGRAAIGATTPSR